MVDRPIGERLARLEAQSEERLSVLNRIEEKLDALNDRVDEHEGKMREALGAFKAFSWVWGIAVAVIAGLSSVLPHFLGWTK